VKMARYITLCLILFATACQDKKQHVPPPDLISKEQFVAILSDIRLLEGAYTTRYARVDSSALNIESYYLKLFQDHGVSRERFTSSYTWYAADQPKMLEIEEAIVTRLGEMQSEAADTTKAMNVSEALQPKVPVKP